MRGKVHSLHTSDVLRAHSYLGARGWELDDAPPADRPAELSGFRVVFGYHRRAATGERGPGAPRGARPVSRPAAC